MLGNKSKTELGHAADKKGISHSEHSEHPVAKFITLHSGYFLLSPLLGQGPCLIQLPKPSTFGKSLGMQGSGGSEDQESTRNAGDLGLVQVPPGMGRSPGEGNHYLLQDSRLENSTNRGAWQATVPGGHKEWDTTAQLTLSLFFGMITSFC